MSDPVLSAAHQIWVAGVLLDGHASEDVVSQLVAAGTPVEVARAGVEDVLRSPAYQVARKRLRAHKLRQAVAVAGQGTVDVREALDAVTFRDTYVALGVPVHLRGFCRDWPAAGWTPQGLADRLGQAEIRVCEGRDQHPTPDRDFQQLTTTMSLADYVDRVLRSGRTNALYTIANHRNLDEGLRPLLSDLTPPPGFVNGDRVTANASFWLGPAGTRTPLHHDTSSVLFCQLHGRKRVRLVPPFADGLAATARGFYASVSLDDPGLADPGGVLDGVPVSEVVLEPGDALLLPAGWWHEVLALDVSISVSLVGLPYRNRFDDYVAGAP